MALVRFGALSPIEMATKLSWNPSRMFGLINKGHLSEGADADITIIDPDQGKAIATYVSGDPVLMDAEIHSKGGTLLVPQEGITAAKNSGLDYEVLDLQKSKLYEGF